MEGEDFPDWLQLICNSLHDKTTLCGFMPNHVLVNRYEFDRGDGIMHHTDGPAYENRVCILSLQTSCVFTFRRKIESSAIGNVEGNDDIIRLVIEPRSLLIFSSDAYTEHLHGIDSDIEVNDSYISCCDNAHLLSRPINCREVGKYLYRFVYSLILRILHANSNYSPRYPDIADFSRAADIFDNTEKIVVRRKQFQKNCYPHLPYTSFIGYMQTSHRLACCGPGRGRLESVLLSRTILAALWYY